MESIDIIKNLKLEKQTCEHAIVLGAQKGNKYITKELFDD